VVVQLEIPWLLVLFAREGLRRKRARLDAFLKAQARS
jgi:hypothetical protein